MVYPAGTVAMANAGPDTNGSQFFLVYADSTLPPDYTVFGTITDGSGRAAPGIAAQGHHRSAECRRRTGRAGDDHHGHRAGLTGRRVRRCRRALERTQGGRSGALR